MSALFQSLLYLHIIIGAIAMVVAPIALATQKGSKSHVFWGRSYFWAMTFVACSALIMAIYNFKPFLIILSVFSYYSVLLGYRAIANKKNNSHSHSYRFDFIALSINGIFCFSFTIWGIYALLNELQGFFAILAIVFGLIGLNFSRRSYLRLTRPVKDGQQWIADHIGGILGGYIATLTAFSVTVLTFLPPFISWIWPTVAITPIIIYCIRHYRKVFSPK